MKKILLILIFLVFTFFSLSPDGTKAAGPPDQFCTAKGGAYTTMIRNVSNQTTQTFKPTVTNISRVTVKIKGDGVGLLGFGIQKNNKILAWNNEGATAEPNGDNQTMTFTFNDLEVLVNQEYSLVPRISTNNYTLYWYYDYDCYDRGAAYVGTEKRDYDFDFAIYGFNADMPPNSALDLDEDIDQNANDNGSVENNEDDTVNSESYQILNQEALTSNITDTIKPPTNLKAVDIPDDKGGSISLTWDKSLTEGIEKYTIFRQTEMDGDIYLIGETKAEILSFIDVKANEGQKFYYFVRANKDGLQSNDSQKVGAVSINNLSVKKDNGGPQKDYIFWYVVGPALIAFITFTAIFIYKKIKAKK